ncbi:helix-turn-helix domain-containing protein [Enterococcus dongliensis]|nr:helix-turn-helix domain-containing protein [Enterococcus dongliensis]
MKGVIMKHLLNSSTYRRIQFVEFLDQLPSWCDIKEATQTIDCSAKTLLADIEFINEFWGEYIYIEYSKFQGVRLNNLTSNKLGNVYYQIYHESLEFQFIEKMLYESNQDADYWINELFMSEASFYRMVNGLEEFLNRRGLVLERAPFRITGPDERWVRFFYQQYFTEAYGVTQWPFALDQEATTCFIMRTSTDFDVVLDDREIQEAAYLFIVTLNRMHQGFYLSKSIYREKDDTIDKVLNLSRPSVEQLLMKTNFTLPLKWYKEISRTVFHEFYNWANPEQNSQMEQKIETFLTSVSQAIEYPLNKADKQKIMQKMLSWFVEYNFYPYRRMLLFDKHQKFAREVQLVYPIFSTIVEIYLKDIEKKSPKLWTDIRLNNVFFLLMKEWSHLPIHLENLRKRVSILIVSDLGQKHAEMLRDFLLANYNKRIAVDTFNEPIILTSPTEFEKFTNYDIVLSNNPIKDYKYKNILIINNFFSSSDRENLLNLIVAIQKEAACNHLKKLGNIKMKTAKEIYFSQQTLQE